ncbi:HK97 family phage prohead protease [Chelatococcus sambhunathii]|uniref:HK97 family phage prohead protease n=1 Tax=Chelatococcus sambhunathii TaxID=363953 RepID=A0ABU1DHL1_9HYPH|nr:HK97 family phage prohead protease [Chelatococcus sambhunathii]MDR4307616.1 HK97 family phage prohead protease [Chelatococcus sambhunathii]
MPQSLSPARVAAPELKRLALTPAVSADGAVEGYASLFGVVDLGRDLVEPGAFAASLRRRGAAGVRFLFQHDPSEPIGAWTSISEDARGLKVFGRLNLAVGRAREVQALLRQGALDGLSIGFRAVRSRRAAGVRRLIEIDLWEVSVVTFPMLPEARVSCVKRLARQGAIPPLARGGIAPCLAWFDDEEPARLLRG